MSNNIITFELLPKDAHRLLWLVQSQANNGHIWNEYWCQMADHLQMNISTDEEPPNGDDGRAHRHF